MHKLRRAALLAGTLLGSGLLTGATLPARAQAAASTQDALRRDIDQAKAKVYPALVNITVVFRYFSEGRAQRAPAGGSGVIISKDGYVVTNFHVAGHTTHIICTLATGEAIDANVVYDDPLSDLSILKLRLDKRADPKAPLAYAPLGDSEAVRVGDFVMAMGNPLMLSSSLTLGVVSNTKRVFTDFTATQIEEQELDEGEKTGLFTRWLQHDALILPGNSGGPLVNLKGEVVGINELGGNGVGFAIPSSIVSDVFQQVKQYGKVKRGWLGLSVMPVNKLGRKDGALVSSVLPGSPADKAGVQPGDILLALDTTPVDVQFFEQVPLFYQAVARLPEGHPVAIKTLRDGQPKTLTATVALMEPMLGAEEEFRDTGLTARALTSQMALVRNLPDRNGILVTGVRPGFPFESAQPKVQEGDVLRSVDGKPTYTLAALRAALADAKDKGEVAVAFDRHDEHLMTVIKPETPKAGDDGGELPRAWIGLKSEVLTPEVAKALNAPDTKGYLITQVLPFTEAAKAGLQTGDILLALNGSKLDASRAQDADDFKRAVEELPVGDKAKLTVLRKGKKSVIDVTLERTPTSIAQAKNVRQKEFEFTVRELTFIDKIDHHWKQEQTGVLVLDATSGGWANIAGLRINDLIVSINGQKTPDVDTFTEVMKQIAIQKPHVIRVFVRRDYLTHFVLIEPDWTKLTASQ